jgi:cytochrome c-type biogenesis protein CcmH/NrfG
MGMPLEARRRMMEVVGRQPENAACWHILGQACSEAEPYFQQAEEAFRRAVALAPGNAQYVADLADMLVKTNRASEAEASYRQALALSPHDPEILSRHAMFLLTDHPSAERRAAAERLLRQALQAAPNDSYTLYALGRLSLDRGEGKQAVHYLRSAIERATQVDTAELWYALSRAYQRSGDPAQAAKALSTASRLRTQYQTMTLTEEQVARTPRDPALRLKLARLYAQRGENAKAIAEYEACLRLNSGSGPARSEMAALTHRLQSVGKMPMMAAYRVMIAGVTQDRTRD